MPPGNTKPASQPKCARPAAGSSLALRRIEQKIRHGLHATGSRATRRACPRIRHPKCDVIWSIGAELLEANADLLEPYQPKDYAMISDAFKSSGAWIPYTGIVNVFVVNTKKLKPRNIRSRGPISRSRVSRTRFRWLTPRSRLGVHAAQHVSDDLRDKRRAGTSSSRLRQPQRLSQLRRSAALRQRRRGRGRRHLEDNAYLYLKAAGRSPSSTPKTARPIFPHISPSHRVPHTEI